MRKNRLEAAREFLGRKIAERTMRPQRVVVSSRMLDDRPGLAERREEMFVKAFNSESPSRTIR